MWSGGERVHGGREGLGWHTSEPPQTRGSRSFDGSACGCVVGGHYGQWWWT